MFPKINAKDTVKQQKKQREVVIDTHMNAGKSSAYNDDTGSLDDQGEKSTYSDDDEYVSDQKSSVAVS